MCDIIDFEQKYRTILNKSQINNIVPSQTNPTHSTQSTPAPTNHNESRIEGYIKVLCTSRLPPVKSDTEYCTPYEIAMFLSEIQDGVRFEKQYISAYTVMTYMIRNKIVPLKKTALYCILDMYLSKTLDPDSKWSIITTTGLKSLLSNAGFK